MNVRASQSALNLRVNTTKTTRLVSFLQKVLTSLPPPFSPRQSATKTTTKPTATTTKIDARRDDARATKSGDDERGASERARVHVVRSSYARAIIAVSIFCAFCDGGDGGCVPDARARYRARCERRASVAEEEEAKKRARVSINMGGISELEGKKMWRRRSWPLM